MPYLELKNITKKYDKLVAVDELDFSVEKNEFAVLFGSSAAGKTTTLRCISGLENPTLRLRSLTPCLHTANSF